tara:strand:+ start:281 stop:535 length:255 start_codon:yes stop_codon:yes gene_type:complete
MINKEKIMDKKITLKDLDFDYDVSGKGTKVKALKDMGVHNMDFDSLEDLYTNEYFKDTTDYMGGDPLSEVLEYDDIGDSDYVLD